MGILSVVKNGLLPQGIAPRKLAFGPAAGVVMNIDFAHQTRLYLGLYERELSPHFRSLVKRGTKCFDVGGNAGYNALMLARLNGGADVVTFECDDACLPTLKANIALNGDIVRVVHGMVGATDTDGMVSLDHAAETHFVPDFIKMDIEGAEGEALRGAGALLDRHKPSWIIEVHGKAVEDDCMAQLKEAGYRPQIIDAATFMPEDRPMEHNRWIVAAKPD